MNPQILSVEELAAQFRKGLVTDEEVKTTYGASVLDRITEYLKYEAHTLYHA